jgi:hypothetical protein
MFLPFIGLEVGLLSMFYEFVFTNLHFHDQNVCVPIWTYFLQILLCHSSYGYDRYLDVKSGDSNNSELIEYINENSDYVKGTIATSFLISTGVLLFNEHVRFLTLPMVLSAIYYKNFKEAFPLLKPAFISLLLITSSVVVPSIIAESNLNVLHDFNVLIPPMANLYSASNYLDIVDYNVDKANNISTLPVLFGNDTALMVSFLANAVSTVSHISHPNFGTPADLFFQAQNIYSGLTLLKQNKVVDFRKNNNKPKMNYYTQKYYIPPVLSRPSFTPRILI